jgi:hypothetical protein
MMMHDDALAESVALLALGVLPEIEAQNVAAHVSACAECGATYADLRGVSDLIGYAAEATPGVLDDLRAARLKSRVMSAVREDVAPDAPSRVPAASLRARSTTPWFAYLSAAAAIVLAILVGVDDQALRSASKKDSAQIADLQAHADAAASVAAAARARSRALSLRLAELTAPDSKHFAVPGGEVITTGGHVLIALRDAPALPAGKVYQAWTLARGAKTVAPSITFAPDASGLTVIQLPEGSTNLVAVALSVEPAGGSKAPTSVPKFVRPLS